MNSINLAHNTNPRGPAPSVRAVLAAMADGDLSDYPPSFHAGGPSALASALAERCAVDVDRIVLGHGAEGLLKTVFSRLLRSGERVFLPSEAWSYYRTLAAGAGAAVVDYPVEPAPTAVPGIVEYRVDVDALLAAHALAPARLLLLASPANPTGELFPADRLEEVLVAFRNAVVVIDEAYWGLGDRPGDFAALPALVRRFPNVVILRTFSKLFALASARLGYAVVGTGVEDVITAGAVYLGHSEITDQLGLASLEALPFYEEVRAGIASDRETLYRSLSLFDDVTVARSAANFVLVDVASGPRKRAAQQALADAGIKVKWLLGPGFAHRARVTIGTAEQTRAFLRAVIPALSSDLAVVERAPRKASYIEAFRAADGSRS